MAYQNYFIEGRKPGRKQPVTLSGKQLALDVKQRNDGASMLACKVWARDPDGGDTVRTQYDYGYAIADGALVRLIMGGESYSLGEVCAKLGVNSVSLAVTVESPR
jgi:hypothetical protein